MNSALNPDPRGAAVPAVINAVINGAIAYSAHKDRAQVPLTVDAISSTDATVGAEAAIIALALAVILTCITAVLDRKALPPRSSSRSLVPAVLGIALENALALFGATVVVDVVWQRVMGTVMVSPFVAAVIVGLFAAVVTTVVHVRSIRALLRV